MHGKFAFDISTHLQHNKKVKFLVFWEQRNRTFHAQKCLALTLFLFRSRSHEGSAIFIEQNKTILPVINGYSRDFDCTSGEAIW